MTLFINNSDNKLGEIKVANNFLARLKGLLGIKMLAENQGLIIPACRSIHTFFMFFPLDIVYLNKEKNVVKIKEKVNPFRISWGPKTTYYVLELKTGMIKKNRIKKG